MKLSRTEAAVTRYLHIMIYRRTTDSRSFRNKTIYLTKRENKDTKILSRTVRRYILHSFSAVWRRGEVFSPEYLYTENKPVIRKNLCSYTPYDKLLYIFFYFCHPMIEGSLCIWKKLDIVTIRFNNVLLCWICIIR